MARTTSRFRHGGQPPGTPMSGRFWLARNAITRAVRAWFDEQGFVEVETAILQVSPGNETHLHAPRTELVGADGARATRYLRTSPEFACKKLLAAGETKDFRVCAGVSRPRARRRCICPNSPCWNGTARTRPMTPSWPIASSSIAHAAQATGIGQFSFRGRTADPFAEPELLTVAAAFERFAGIDLLATIADGEGDRAQLAAAADRQVRITDDDTWSDIFSKVLVEHVEPNLGQGRLTVLFEYPVPEAALARANASDPRVAERFEIYACGVELANGFGELTDAAEQRRRFTLAMDEKQRRYGERYPLDEDFLDAVGHDAGSQRRRAWLRPAGDAGERRARRIDQVVWTPPAGDDMSKINLAFTPRRCASPPNWSRMALRPAADLADLEKVAARYAIAVTPDIAALIDPDDPDDPIARQFIPSAEELVARANEKPDPIGDHAHSPVAGIVHRYPDRVLFKLVHVCAVYCRFCFRREMVGPGKATALPPAAYETRSTISARIRKSGRSS